MTMALTRIRRPCVSVGWQSADIYCDRSFVESQRQDEKRSARRTLAAQGLYGLALPGGLPGSGAGVFKTRSKVVPAVCGLLALALGLFTEWHFAPFVADTGLGYFVSHIHQLRPITLIMIAVGTLIGFWIPFRRGQEARTARRLDATSQAETTDK